MHRSTGYSWSSHVDSCREGMSNDRRAISGRSPKHERSSVRASGRQDRGRDYCSPVDPGSAQHTSEHHSEPDALPEAVLPAGVAWIGGDIAVYLVGVSCALFAILFTPSLWLWERRDEDPRVADQPDRTRGQSNYS